MKPFPVLLTGPTGSGKTAVSLELARLIPCRILSADSMQVYRRLEIGTAKPTPAERAAVPHYGLDLVDPVRPYSVAEWLVVAQQAVEETLAAGEWPLIVGGTRLYIQALTGPFDPGSPPDAAIRDRLYAEAEARGTAALHEKLAAIDPLSAARIAPADRKRVVRALEVWEATGRSLSQLQAESREQAPEPLPGFTLAGDRDLLYRRVEARTAAMIKEGWIEEVAALLNSGFGPGLDRIKAHGYRELAAVVQGERSLEDAIAAINQNVRHYVRYQLGWIRGRPALRLLDPAASPSENAAKLQQWIMDVDPVLQPSLLSQKPGVN